MHIPIISELLLRRRVTAPEDPGTEVEDFSWVIQTTTPNERYEFALVTYDSRVATIDWGDGGLGHSPDVNASGFSIVTHTYAEAGLYIISVSGQHSTKCIYPGYSADHRNKVISVLNMNLPGYLGNSNMSLGEFRDCANLTSFGDNFKFANTITNLVNTFNTCSNLSGNIPKLPSDFNGSLNSTFKYCGKLTGFVTEFTIPTNVTDLSYTFDGCLILDRLVSIPLGYSGSLAGTFRDCSEVTTLPVGFVIPDNTTNLTETFRGCIKLTEIPLIPSGFTGQAGYTFQSCTSLVTLPTGFSIPNNSSVNIYGLFQDCISLTEIPSIPPLYRGSLAYTFKNCSSLGLLPSGFAIPKASSLVGTFDGCTSMAYFPISIASDFVGSMQNCFNNCSGVYHELPDNFAIPAGVTSLQNTFSNCITLTEIPLLPPGYSGNLISTFLNCTSLQALPPGFSIPVNVTSMNSTFDGAGLTSLPQDFTFVNLTCLNYRSTFANSALVSIPSTFRFPVNDSFETSTNLSRIFSNCIDLTSIPVDLFNNTGSAALILDLMCYGCSSLQNIPIIPAPFSVSMISTFSGCASVTQFPAGFEIPSTVINLYCAFRGMTSLLEIPYFIWPSNWSSSNISIGLMFYRDADQGTIPTGTINSEFWTTFASSFTNIDKVFRNCSALTNYADIPAKWK